MVFELLEEVKLVLQCEVQESGGSLLKKSTTRRIVELRNVKKT